MLLFKAMRYGTVWFAMLCFAACSQAVASTKPNTPTGKSGSVVVPTQASIPPLAGALHVLPPLGRDRPSMNFDATLLMFLKVTVCRPSSGGCQPVSSFLGSSCGSADSCIVLEPAARDDDRDRRDDRRQDKRAPVLYRVDWKPAKGDFGKDHDGKRHGGRDDDDDDDYQIHFSVAGLEISSLSYELHDRRELPIRFSIDNHPRIRARVLHAQGQGAAQVAAAIHSEFALGGVDTTRILLQEQFSDDDIGKALVAVFNPAAQLVAQWMHDAGGSPCDSVQLLSDVFGADVSTVNTDLLAAGYAPGAVQGCLIQKVAQEHAPLIYLHPNEQFFPSSVDFALTNETVNCYEAGAPPMPATRSFPAIKLLDAGWTKLPDGSWTDGNSAGITLPEATAQNGQKNKSTCYLTTNTPLSGPYDCNTADGQQCSHGLEFLFGDSAGVTSGRVPVYLSIYSLGPGVFNVEYKTFYPYNYGKKACTGFWSGGCTDVVVQDDNHVGDWEGMSIQFVNFTVNAVRTGAHSTDTIGTTYVVDNTGTSYKNLTDLQWADATGNLSASGTHPVVYAANGSHGIWGDTGESDGSHTYMTIATGQPLIDTTKAGGAAWQTWKSTVVVSQEGLDKGWFAAYKGRWGNSEKIIPTNESMCVQAAHGLLDCVGACTDDLISEFPLNPGPTTPPAARDSNTLPARYVSLAAFQSGASTPSACKTTLQGIGYGGPMIRLADAVDPSQSGVFVGSPSSSALPGCEIENRASTFRIEPGRAPGGVSIESVSRPGSFLYLLPAASSTPAKLAIAAPPQATLPDGTTANADYQLFAQNSTFNAVPGLASASGTSNFSLQAVYPPQGFDSFLRILGGSNLGLLAQVPAGDNGQDATFTVENPVTNYRPGMHWGALDESPLITTVRPGSENGGTYIIWVRNHSLRSHHITIYPTLVNDCYAADSHRGAAELSPGMQYGFTSSLFTYGTWDRVDEDDSGSNDAEICQLFPIDLTALAYLLDAAYVLAFDVVMPEVGTALAVGALAAGGYAAYLGITDPNQLNSDLDKLGQCTGDAAKAIQAMFLNAADSAGFITTTGISALQDEILKISNFPTDDDRTVALWQKLDGSYCFAHQDGPCF